MLTIVAYHYVRDLPNTPYPEIKGLQTEKFEGQIDYINKHYDVCSLKQVLSAMHGVEPLPAKACLLTFDDGLADHYQTVFPILKNRGLTGSFFPPAEAIEKNKVLNVHKIHFILATIGDIRGLVTNIFSLLKLYRSEFTIPDDDELYQRFARPNRYDSKEISFVKTILQKGLPERIRTEVIQALFEKYVHGNEEDFAKELYVSIEQLQTMQRGGMEIGGHGYKHNWLETLPLEEQRTEITRTVNFLTKVFGSKLTNWTMCYPYGSYNQMTIEVLKQADCAIGLSTKMGVVSDFFRPFELMRLDTNDLPFSGDADISDWTLKMLETNS